MASPTGWQYSQKHIPRLTQASTERGFSPKTYVKPSTACRRNPDQYNLLVVSQGTVVALHLVIDHGTVQIGVCHKVFIIRISLITQQQHCTVVVQRHAPVSHSCVDNCTVVQGQGARWIKRQAAAQVTKGFIQQALLEMKHRPV
eukprot:scpid37050/ scgid11176/ 